jgi:hypothetical protein
MGDVNDGDEEVDDEGAGSHNSGVLWPAEFLTATGTLHETIAWSLSFVPGYCRGSFVAFNSAD